MLKKRIIEHIQHFGPMRVRTFQDIALFDSKAGYYSSSLIIGRQGDFITSPEISQIFGEILALSIVNHWHIMGCPSDVLIAELGPGRGALMADILRTFKQFPDFYQTIQVYLVEVCPALIREQKHVLGDSVTHVPSLTVVPEADVTFIVANEFFDALPIEQFVVDPKTKTKEHRLIDYNDIDGLHFSDGHHFRVNEKKAFIIETSEASLACADKIKRRLSQGRGMAVIIDYGDDCEKNGRENDLGEKNAGENNRVGDTLQAVWKHQRVSLFDHIGQADLSHHVDFAALRRAFEPLKTTLMTQGDFLVQNGIYERTEQLVQRHPEHASDLRLSSSRMIAPSAMGSLFKVFTVIH